MQSHILSIILLTPLVGAFVLLFVPKENKDAIRWIANLFALGGLLISIPVVPMYLLIGVWGLARTRYASIKFFLDKLLGSLLMVLAILVPYFHRHTRTN